MHPQPASILVVDDEPDLRTLYELTLLREGYRVETAADIAQARQLLAHNRYEVVITDMRLPDGFGMELLHDLRKQQRTERSTRCTDDSISENAGFFCDRPRAAQRKIAEQIPGSHRRSRDLRRRLGAATTDTEDLRTQETLAR